jgi:hypothetical protein
MSAWVGVPYRVIAYIAISIPTLRICLVWNNRIRLGKVVNIVSGAKGTDEL